MIFRIFDDETLIWFRTEYKTHAIISKIRKLLPFCSVSYNLWENIESKNMSNV